MSDARLKQSWTTTCLSLRFTTTHSHHKLHEKAGLTTNFLWVCAWKIWHVHYLWSKAV